MKQKFSKSVAHVMEYIKFSEMGGEIDDTHVYHPTYLDLRDILSQVKDEEEILDEDTQEILPAFQPENHPDTNDNERWDDKQYDTELDLNLWSSPDA